MPDDVPGTSPVSVRLARAEDVLPAARVRVASWRVAYAGIVAQETLDALDPEADARPWQEHREQFPDRLLVALVDDVVEGFAWTCPERSPDAPPGTAEISAFYVSPTAWRRGIGAALMGGTVEHLAGQGFERVWLWVLEDNERGRAFYAGVGFAPTDERKTEVDGLIDVRYVRDL